MSTTFYVCAVVIVIIVVIGILSTRRSLNTYEREHMEKLNKFPLDELEKIVYRYESEYFKYIGEEHEPVLEFKGLIENRDISTLYRKWKSSFVGSFIELERRAGNNGRSMLGEDYYPWYDLEVTELFRRKNEEL